MLKGNNIETLHCYHITMEQGKLVYSEGNIKIMVSALIPNL